MNGSMGNENGVGKERNTGNWNIGFGDIYYG